MRLAVVRRARAERKVQFLGCMRLRIFAVIFGGLLGSACTDICGVRGGPDEYTGSESFVATVPGLPSGAAGTDLSNATLDWDPYEQRRDVEQNACGDLVAITITTHDCRLVGNVTSLLYETENSAHTTSNGHVVDSSHGGPFISASANISSGTCTLAIAGKKTDLDMSAGTVSWDDSRSMHLTASGASVGGTNVAVSFEGATTGADWGCSAAPRSGGENGMLVGAAAMLMIGIGRARKTRRGQSGGEGTLPR